MTDKRRHIVNCETLIGGKAEGQTYYVKGPQIRAGYFHVAIHEPMPVTVAELGKPDTYMPSFETAEYRLHRFRGGDTEFHFWASHDTNADGIFIRLIECVRMIGRIRQEYGEIFDDQGELIKREDSPIGKIYQSAAVLRVMAKVYQHDHPEEFQKRFGDIDL